MLAIAKREGREFTKLVPSPKSVTQTPGCADSHRSSVHWRCLAGNQLPQHKLQNTAIGVVLRFLRCIDSHQRIKLFLICEHFKLPAGSELPNQIFYAQNFEEFFTSQAQRLRTLARQKLQRQNSHADQVRTMNAFVALCNYRAHAEQSRALGRPVTR